MNRTAPVDNSVVSAANAIPETAALARINAVAACGFIGLPSCIQATRVRISVLRLDPLSLRLAAAIQKCAAPGGAPENDDVETLWILEHRQQRLGTVV